MSDGVFKTPKAKKTMKTEENQLSSIPPKKRSRTAEDFITFCNFILEHENYEAQKQEELRSKPISPLGRVEGMSENIKCESTTSASSTSSEDRKGTDIESGTSDEDSYDLVTCYCLKPFAGRPMIECSECLTWIHLSCAKIRKSNIPDEFTCQRCKDAKMTTRRSQRKDGDRDSLSPSWVH